MRNALQTKAVAHPLKKMALIVAVLSSAISSAHATGVSPYFAASMAAQWSSPAQYYTAYGPYSMYSTPVLRSVNSFPIGLPAMAPFYGFNAFGFPGNSLYQVGILPTQTPYGTGQLALQANYISQMGGDPTALYQATQFNWSGTQPLGYSYLPPVGTSAVTNYWNYRSHAGRAE